MNEVTLGQYLASLRAKQRWTKEQAAQVVGTVASNFYYWEHDIARPKVKMLRLLEAAYGLAPNVLDNYPSVKPWERPAQGCVIPRLPQGAIWCASYCTETSLCKGDEECDLVGGNFAGCDAGEQSLCPCARIAPPDRLAAFEVWANQGKG